MEIQTKMMELCKSCPYFYPKTDLNDLYADGKTYHREIVISCGNDHLCRQIREFMEGEKHAAEKNQNSAE